MLTGNTWPLPPGNFVTAISLCQALQLLKAPMPAQTELVELTAELISGADGAHIGYEACPSSSPVWRLHVLRSCQPLVIRVHGV